MRSKRVLLLVIISLVELASARAAEQSTVSTISSGRILEENGATTVIIEASGPLPLPVLKTLTDPPRIYFDLANVAQTITEVTAAAGGGVVTRMRIARRDRSTRVVLDLTRRESFRLNADDLKTGRIRIVVGTESAPRPAPPARRTLTSPAAPVPGNLSPPAAPPANPYVAPPPAPPLAVAPPPVRPPAQGTVPAPPAAAKPAPTRSPVLSPSPQPVLPARDVAEYRVRISGFLVRMQVLRATIVRIDAGESVAFDTLMSTAQEYAGLRLNLEAVKPSPALAATHDSLMSSCTFGAMAARFGLDAAREGTPEARQRAASAAAGALMLLERACVDLGCSSAR